MKTYFLCTKSLKDLQKKLSWCFTEDDEGNLVRKTTRNFSIDIIGDIFNDDRVVNEEGETIKEATKLQGFHANIICTDEYAARIPESIKVEPSNPKRVFKL